MAHRRGGKTIDTVHWTYGSFAESALTAGVAGQTVYSAQHLSETLLRIRGEWTAGLDGTKAPAVGISVSVGLIQVPEGTGTTVLWSPITDGDAPWIWWDVMNLQYEEPVVDAISTNLSGARRIIDSKAMRKMRNTEIQFVAENATVQAASGVNIAGAIRTLFGS